MLDFLIYAAVAVYGLCSLIMLGYGLKAYYLVWVFAHKARQMLWRARLSERRFQRALARGETELPEVTTQLPIYNEYNVAERAIRAIAAMDYPKDRHEIQILDDSSDETKELIDAVADDLRKEGHTLSVIRRVNREGFKAGALKEGLKTARGEFIAVFDADFVPPTEFLQRCVAHFRNAPERCLVQARWGHLNRDDSLLTKAVALGIDGHFAIEQPARSWSNLFLNFNGTGGLWRREAIDDAGGWRATTLTEDLELSYRAQLRGWKIFFLHDLVVPAEIPSTYEAFKSQQFRWAKGSIQTAKLLLPRLLRQKLPLRVKVHSIFHLTQYSMHPCMLLASLLSIPMLLGLYQFLPEPSILWVFALVPLLAATFGPSMLYIASQVALDRPVGKTFAMIPKLMLVGFGICLSNSHAVLEALLGVSSPFVRTPKKGARSTKAYGVKRNALPWLEAGMGFYTVGSLMLSIALTQYFISPYLLIYSLGFFTVGFASLRERRASRESIA